MEWTNFYMLFFKKDKMMCRFKAMDKDPEDGGKKDVQTRLFLKENRRDKVSTAPKRCVYDVGTIRLRH